MNRIINDSGHVYLQDGVIRYDSDVYGTWSLPLSRVCAIGEFTNQDGPSINDWFLIVLTSDAAYDASCYAQGRERFLRDLSDILGADIICGLAHSADFRSHFLWPPHLKGQRLFEYRERRFRMLVETRIPPEVWEAIQGASPDEAGR